MSMRDVNIELGEMIDALIYEMDNKFYQEPVNFLQEYLQQCITSIAAIAKNCDAVRQRETEFYLAKASFLLERGTMHQRHHLGRLLIKAHRALSYNNSQDIKEIDKIVDRFNEVMKIFARVFRDTFSEYMWQEDLQLSEG